MTMKGNGIRRNPIPITAQHNLSIDMVIVDLKKQQQRALFQIAAVSTSLIEYI